MNLNSQDNHWNRRHGIVAGPLTAAAPASKRARAPKDHELRLALGERLRNLDLVMASPIMMAYGSPQGYLQQTAPLHAGQWQVPPQAMSWAVSSAMSEANALLEIRAYIKHAISAANAGKPAFRETNQGWQITSLGMHLWQLLPTLRRLSSGLKANMFYDPHVQLALEACRHVGLDRFVGGHMGGWFCEGHDLPAMASLFNMFMHEIGRRGDRTAMGRALQAREDLHKRRMSELRAYFGSLLKHHPHCHLERLELRMPCCATKTESEAHQFIVEVSARFMRRAKKRFGSLIVGDVRKIDHTPTGTYQVHVLLALDGSSPEEEVTINQALLECWAPAPSAKDHAFDCNAMPDFTYRGTGALVRARETLAGQLDKAAMFLAGTDRLLHVRPSGTQDGLMIGMLAGRPLP